VRPTGIKRFNGFRVGAQRGAIRRQLRPRRTRIAACALSAALLAVTTSACGGSSSPSGSYTATISPAENLGRLATGTWTVTFGKGGTYAVARNEAIGLATGPGSFYRGTTFVITPLSEIAHPCGPGPATGTYRLKLSGNQLTFIRIVDPCTTRAAILTRTFTKTKAH
jgi:hypothetical protein